jgi:hypothetical protein
MRNPCRRAGGWDELAEQSFAPIAAQASADRSGGGGPPCYRSSAPVSIRCLVGCHLATYADGRTG